MQNVEQMDGWLDTSQTVTTTRAPAVLKNIFQKGAFLRKPGHFFQNKLLQPNHAYPC